MSKPNQFTGCPCCEHRALYMHSNADESRFWVVSACGNFGPYADSNAGAWTAWADAVESNPGAFLPPHLRPVSA